MIRRPRRSPLFPYTPLSRSDERVGRHVVPGTPHHAHVGEAQAAGARIRERHEAGVAIAHGHRDAVPALPRGGQLRRIATRSEEHTSELQSLAYLVCRLLLEK